MLWASSAGTEFCVCRSEGPVVVELASAYRRAGLHCGRSQSCQVALIEQRGKRGAAARRGEGDDSGGSIGAIENAVGAAIGFDAGDAGGGEAGEVEDSADVFDGNAVEEDLVGVGVAAANKEGGDADALAGLHDVKSGDLAQRIDHVDAVGEVGRWG